MKTIITSALLMAAFAASGSAMAGKFGVRVVDDAGEPVAGAAVCIGLEGNYKQFGALFTDMSGEAVVDVPNVPLVVTVSKSRFTGTRITEPARGFNLIKEVKLSEGVPGPRCRAGSSLADANPPRIEVRDIDVSEGIYTTTLTPSVTGEPSHYRVSNTTDFTNSDWQRFKSTIALPGALTDEPSIYLQLRRLEGSGNNWLEARSSVVTVQMPVQ